MKKNKARLFQNTLHRKCKPAILTAMKTTLHIEGMSCDHCVRHVKDALEEIGGVKSVSVSLADKRAVVEHDTDLIFDVLKKAVEDADYQVIV